MKIYKKIANSNFYKGYRKLVALDNGKYMSSSLAFYLFISLLPILTIFVMILSVFNVSNEYAINLLEFFLPTNLDIINSILEHLHKVTWISVFSLGFSFLVAVYMSSRGIEIIVNFADDVYGYTEINEKTFKKKLRSIVFTLSVLISLGAIISGYLTIETWTETFLPHSWIIWLRFPFLLLMFMSLLMAIMIFTPRKRQSIKSTYRGVFFSAFSITVMISGFMTYVTYFNDYTTIYGPIATIIILLLLLFFCSYLLLIGIYINAIKSRHETIFS